MEQIRELEAKFKKLDAKLNTNENLRLNSNEKVKLICNGKVYSIYKNYNNSYNRINTKIFNPSKQKKYKNGLNECRQEMLDQLIQKRNDQLEQVNEFTQSQDRNNFENSLEDLSKSIKLKYLGFARGSASVNRAVYESILFRSKLGNPLKFDQLVNYSKWMLNEKTVSLAQTEYLLNPKRQFFFHLLPCNNIFIYCYRNFVKNDRKSIFPNYSNMFVLNESGDLIHFKNIIKPFEYVVRVNATNIITLYKDDKVTDDKALAIYNFKLELIHSIKLRKPAYDFQINNYEIGLKYKTISTETCIRVKILCYNYKTAKKLIQTDSKNYSKYQTIEMNKREFKSLSSSYMEWYDFELFELNDEFLFIKGMIKRKSSIYSTYSVISPLIILLNRANGNSLFKYFQSNAKECFIYNDQICCHTCCNNTYNYHHLDEPLVLMLSINSSDEKKTFTLDCEKKFPSMYSTSKHKYIYAKKFDKKSLTLKFNHY